MSFGALPTGAIDRPRSLGYGARLGDLWLRLNPTRDLPLNIYARDQLADRQADTSNVYENVFDLGYVFSRSDFSGGEGLDQFPRPTSRQTQERDDIRFFDSRNIVVERPSPGEPASIKLAHKWTTVHTGSISNTRPIGASNERLYIGDDTEIKRFDTLASSTPDASQDFTPNFILSLAVTAHDEAIAVLNNGTVWHKWAGTSSWAQVENTAGATADAYRVWAVKDRFILLKNSGGTPATYALGELDFDTARQNTTFTSFDTTRAEIYQVIDADTAILAIGDDGFIRSYVPQTDTAGGTPSLTIRARTPLPGNEIPYSIGHNSGVLLILTSQRNADATTRFIRAYNAQVLDERFDYVIGNLQLMREWTDKSGDWGETTHTAANVWGSRDIVSDRDQFFWVICEDSGEVDNDGVGAYLWTQDLVTRGLSRISRVEAAPVATQDTGLVIWRDRIHWSGDNEVTYRQDISSYQDEGFLISPNITFGVNDDINWISSVIHTLDVRDADGAQVEVFTTTNPDAIGDWRSSSWKLVTRVSSQSSSGVLNTLLETLAPQLAFQIRLHSNNAGAGTPRVTRTEVRGFPSHRDIIVDLPVSVSDYIEVPGRRSTRIPHYGTEIHEMLLQRLGKHYQLHVVEPELFVRGIVDQIAEPIEYISNRGSVTKVCLVRFRGNYQPGGQGLNPIGDQTMGLGLMGVMVMGVGQTGAV